MKLSEQLSIWLKQGHHVQLKNGGYYKIFTHENYENNLY